MNAPDPVATSIERRSLELGKWANLLMAVAGIVAAHFSRADAFLVDGLYSGLNFVSAIVAAKISQSVLQPADRRYPFGYSAYEALYVNFRALVLLGIIIFALFSAVHKIILYATGADVPELVFGPIFVYTVLMVAICFGLATWHHFNWKRSGRRSELLSTECKAAVVDGVISGGAGGGLLAAGLLRGTTLDFIVPVADAIIVIVMTALITREPVVMFLTALREVAGESAEPSTREKVQQQVEELLRTRPYSILEIAVTKTGRTHFVVPYLKPEGSVDATELDELTNAVESTCGAFLGDVQSAIIITAKNPYECVVQP